MTKFIYILFLSMSPFLLISQTELFEGGRGMGVAQESQSTGIEFFDGNWSEIKAESKKTGKPIFMDAYTTWCGPCKMMSSRVFPDEAVGKFYNANFVNVKIDMEKGEGIDLAKAYEVKAYPTLLFLDAEGEILHTGVGYRDAQALIELGKDAMDPKKQFSAAKRKYEQGNKNPEFLKEYALMLKDTYDSNAGEVASEYMKSQSDWTTKDNVMFMSNFVGDSRNKISMYMLQNPKVFENILGEEQVDELRTGIVVQELQLHGKSMSESDFDNMLSIVLGDDPRNEEFKMYYYQINGQNEKVIDYMKGAGYEKAKGNAGALNSHAWFVYENSDSKRDLKSAISWIEEAIVIEKNYAYMDTRAALLLKRGKYKKGMAAAEEAIAFAKANDEDYSDTLELISKFKK